jgi:hypothetical protein
MWDDVIHDVGERRPVVGVTLRHDGSQAARALPAERIALLEERRASFPSGCIPSFPLTPSSPLSFPFMCPTVPTDDELATTRDVAVPH